MKSKSYFGDKINKVKLYKKGKFWVAASMTFVTLGLGAISTVSADQVTSVSSSSSISVVAENKSASIASKSESSKATSVASKSESSKATSVASKSESSKATSVASENESSKTTSVASENESSKTTSVASENESSKATSVASENESSKTTSVASENESSKTTSVASENESSKATSVASENESSKATSVASENESSKATSVASESALDAQDNDNGQSLANSNDKAANDDSLFTKETVTASDQLMQKMSRSSFAAYDPHYGTWTIYFQDTTGAMLYYPVGWTDSTSSQIKSKVTPIVNQIEDEGYSYDYAQIFYSNIGSYSYNYVTLVFKEAPLVKGGAVTVNYVDSATKKVLKTGSATYEDRSGDTTNTPYVGCTYKTNSITIPGYTLSKTPSNATGKITENPQTVEYDYTPNQEKAQIQIVDGSENNKVLDTVTVSGTYGSTSNYDINSYVSSKYSNYNIQSNNWPGSITWNSSNDGTVPTYQVVLTHKTQSGTDTRTITQTINYQYSNGKQAEPTKTTSIVFTRPSTTDEVTGVTTYGDWTNETGTTEFPSVQSPQITGYTPSYSQSSAVTGITPNSSDNTQTVVYVPNKEEMTIVYYDMDEKKVLQEKILQGDYGTSPNYDYQSVIQGYVNAGYNIARNQIPSSGLVFSNASGQQYEVDFTHTMEKLPADAEGLTGVVTHTIHYVDTSGKTMAPDVVQTITYTRGATEDKVTGKITYTDWTTTTSPAEFPSVTSPDIPGYTPSQTDSGVLPVNIDFPEYVHVSFPSYNETIVYTKDGGSQTPTGATSTVTETIHYINDSGVALTSPTTVTITFKRNADGTYTAEGNDDFPAVQAPSIPGYTPNVSSIPEIDNVKATDANIEKTIVYSPQQSQIIITYYDQTSKKLIKSDTLIGNYNTSPNYDINTTLDVLKKEGYAEVDSNVPSSLIYSNSPQSYTVNLKHTYTESTQNATVTQTINYKYADGATAATSVNKQLTFTRTATTDNVLGTTQYSPWSPTSGEFPSVVSPTITGYTPTEQESQAIENVNGSTPNNVQNIVYNANQETIDVNYIDQTTGKTINTVVLQGAYNTTSDYTTASDLQTLEKEGYVLVQDNYPANGAKFDTDGVVKSYNVLLKENVTTSTESQTVTQTIHYVDSNNNTVAPDKSTSITFTRDVSTNQVTHAKTYGAWTPVNGQFPAVTSPKVTGYTVTPGQEQSQAVNVSPTSKDNIQTITYTANQEKAIVQYIDETTNTVLSTVDLSGAYNTHDSYSPASTIQKYTNEGYKLDSDEFPQNGVVYNYDGTTPVYKITFEHNTRVDTTEDNPDNVPADELTHTVSQTINYVYSNGTKAENSVTNSVTFNRSVTVDQVTHKVVSEGSWTPTSGTYPAVTSPTITGYTPDIVATTANNSVLPTDTDSTVTVTYTPNAEHAVVNYVDDATGKTVASQTVDGTFGSTVTYDPTSEENTLEGEGYIIGSNDLPTGDKITFSQDGQVPTYTVHLNEGTTTYTPSNNPNNLDLTHTVNQTIHYVYSNGKQAASDATAQVTFQRNATKNNVTGAITYTNWTPATQTFPAVTSPTITGYTPSASASTAVDINESSADNTQTITYTANAEHAVVNYVDDATGKTVASQTVDGTFGSTVTYDPTSEENTLESKGYTIGSNDLPAGDKITFSQDGQVPTYTVHLNEGTTTYTPSNNPNDLDLTHTVNQTIHYVYSNGKQAASDATAQVTFQRNATKNNVTGAITYTNWTPATQTFPAVTSPTITGYTPSASASTAVDVNESSADNTQTITYTANAEHAVVNYVDDTTGKTVASQTVNGTFGSTVTYDPTSEENTLKGEGYTIGSNDLPAGDKITFSQDGQVPTYTVHLNEGTTTYTPSNNPNKLDLTHTVNQTIHYVYSNGKQAASDATAQVTFQRNATKNNVTGAITYTNWTPANQEFPAVQSPTITGYTPSASASTAVDVNEGSADNTQTITYTANAEHAVVNYVDDTTGKIVASQTVNGTFGSTVTYDPTSEENTLKGEGYTIGSNDLPAGDKITFNKNGQVLTYTVHLNEGTSVVYTPDNNPDGLDLTRTIDQTIYYVYSNGKQAAPNATAQVTFQRDVIKNNVTGKLSYTNWTPANQEFPAIVSPEITGYVPDVKASSVVEVNENSRDNTQFVIYTPNAEHAVVNYVDDVTGKTVASQTVDGTFGSTVTYDPTSEENTLKDAGYIIGSNDLPAGDKITFSQDGQVPTYTVHLNEGTTTYTPSNNPNKLDLTHTINQTIHYVYSNGKQAAPDVTAHVTFHRDAVESNVTGKITYTDWTPTSQTFGAVASPEITGYIPDAKASSVVEVNENSEDNVQTIIYTPNAEHAVVNYVDDTTGKTVASQIVNGTLGETVTYDPTSEENALKNAGYIIGNSDLPNNGQIKFTQNGQVPTYTVHLNENVSTITPDNNSDKLDLTHTVSQTIHYVYSNGKQAAPDAVAHITFHRNATKNDVTGAVTYTNWTPTKQEFPAVQSPTITGYTPNASASTAVNIDESSADNTQTITYTPNAEHAVINYVDDVTGKTVASQTVDGTFGSTVTYDPTGEENSLEDKGYMVKNSDLPTDNKITFNQNGPVPMYTIHLGEKTNTITSDNNPNNLDLTKTVTRTINYVDANGKQLTSGVVQTVTFTRIATVNQVTGKTEYSNWQPSGSDNFNEVNSPVVKGYTTTQKVVDAENDVPVSSNDQTINVTYTVDKPAQPSESAKQPATPEHKPSEPAKKPTVPEEKPSEPAKKPTVPEEKPSEPAKKPTVPEEKPSEPAKKPTVPEEKPSESAKKPQASVEKSTEHVQPLKKLVQTAKSTAGRLKTETVKKAVSMKQTSSANEGTIRVVKQSTKIEKQTSNDSAPQSSGSKNILPQTGEDSTSHTLSGELLIVLSGLLGFLGIGKRKKDKEE